MSGLSISDNCEDCGAPLDEDFGICSYCFVAAQEGDLEGPSDVDSDDPDAVDYT